MNGRSRREYLEVIYTRYRQAERREKQVILGQILSQHRLSPEIRHPAAERPAAGTPSGSAPDGGLERPATAPG
jgi:hypothetical protein